MTDENIERRGPVMEGEYVSSATCDRCLKGIESQLTNIVKELGEVKKMINNGKTASNRRAMIWIAAVGALVGLLSNLDKLAALFRIAPK